jgi:ribose 5-phosphate isomerase RpiB
LLLLQAAILVQQSRSQGGQDRAVLTCGTGMGMAIIANKFPDVYAAVVESVAAAGNAAAINNANVLTMGGTIWKVRIVHASTQQADMCHTCKLTHDGGTAGRMFEQCEAEQHVCCWGSKGIMWVLCLPSPSQGQPRAIHVNGLESSTFITIFPQLTVHLLFNVQADDAAAAVDKWLSTKFKEGYPRYEVSSCGLPARRTQQAGQA